MSMSTSDVLLLMVFIQIMQHHSSRDNNNNPKRDIPQSGNTPTHTHIYMKWPPYQEFELISHLLLRVVIVIVAVVAILAFLFFPSSLLLLANKLSYLLLLCFSRSLQSISSLPTCCLKEHLVQ